MGGISINSCIFGYFRGKNFSNKGFSLVEIIIVLTIMAILVLVAVPTFIGYKEKVKKEVCNTSCLQLERMYQAYLILEDIGHSEAVFAEYFQEYGGKNCLHGGKISYVDGKVQCSVHLRDDDRESDDEDVPFL